MAAVIVAGSVQLGSQSSNASIVFLAIPPWGQDGQISGYIYGVNSSQLNLYLYEFLPDLGWYQMSCGRIQIDGTGQFSLNGTTNLIDRTATRYSAYLVPASLNLGCLMEASAVPFLVTHNAVASATIPRLPQDPVISFGGLNWHVKSPPIPVYPGPQFYVQNNAVVDSLGQLHLDLSQCSGSWCAAEVVSVDAVGYGSYTFTLNSQVNNLDPNVTLGMFVWDGQASDQSFREWDIEFGRWGNANAAANAQYVVQPYTVPGNLNSFLMSPSILSTHTVIWLPNQMRFTSVSGSNPTGPQIYQWNYPGPSAQIPTPGDNHLHINFYVAVGSAPVQKVNREIIVSGFQYTPLGSQIGFGRTADAVGFQSSSNMIPVNGGPGCSGTIESDSPWLTAPAFVSAGASLQYSVTQNSGNTRTGNLILRSSNCTPTIGAQILSVSQGGLICSPAFTSQSASVGFLGGSGTVGINGTAPSCSWTVSSLAPWLQIQSPPSGFGDGLVEFSAQSNADASLRQGGLSLNSGSLFHINQDGNGSYFAISPSVAEPCNSETAQFAASWIASQDVELQLNSPTGAAIGRFGPVGSVKLPALADGNQVFLTQAGSGGSVVLGSAVASVVQSNCGAASISAGGVVNGASFSPVSIAPGSLATVFGSGLSGSSAQAGGGALPTTLGGTSVSLSGILCPLLFVSPTQINFLVPSNVPPGRYLLTAGNATSEVIVSNAAPGIFTVRGDGTGVPNASAVFALNDGTTVPTPIFRCEGPECGGTPIIIPPNVASLYLVLYGTGIRNAQKVSATFGATRAAVLFAGPQTQFPGLDQINLQITQLAGLSGPQTLQIVTDGINSNAVMLLFP